MQIRNFSKIGDSIEAPNLAELQVAAYGRFLQPDLLPHQRQPIGLEAIFREIFPIVGADGAIRMEYLGYELGQPHRSEEECRHLELSYCRPLRLRLRIVGAESVEEDVYMADVPKMIGCGEFIINGSERVVVSQIQRSAGVDFDEVKDDSGQTAYSCRFIPERGTWVEFTVGRRDVLQVRLGQSGRMPATWLLRAMLGPDSGGDADILALFYERETLAVAGGGKANGLEGRYLAGELVNPETGEIIARAGARISRELSETLAVSGMKEVAVLKNVEDKLLLNTLESDVCKSSRRGGAAHLPALPPRRTRLARTRRRIIRRAFRRKRQLQPRPCRTLPHQPEVPARHPPRPADALPGGYSLRHPLPHPAAREEGGRPSRRH